MKVNDFVERPYGGAKENITIKNPTMKVGFSIGRGDWIWTNDNLLPKQVRYQAALHPDEFCAPIYTDFKGSCQDKKCLL